MAIGSYPPFGTVLVAEDDDAFRELVASALTQDGMAVITVSDGSEAIDYLDDAFSDAPAGLVPDVVVTDLHMTEGSGFEVVACASGTWQVPTILITAFGDDRSLARARALGAARCLRKPVTLSELRAAVREAMAQGHSAAAS